MGPARTSSTTNAPKQAPLTRRILMLGTLQSGKTSIFIRLSRRNPFDIDLPESSTVMQSARLNTSGRFQLFGRSLGKASKRTEPGTVELYDPPGVSTLFAQGSDEVISRNAVLELRPDAILVVADARHLARSLALFAQVAELGIPTLVAVNMDDAAKRAGIHIDYGLLESLIGVPVVRTVATQSEGLSHLISELSHARVPNRIATLPNSVTDTLEVLQASLESHSRMWSFMALTLDDDTKKAIRARFGVELFEQIETVVSRLQRELSLPVEVILTERFHTASASLSHQVVQLEASRRQSWDVLGRLTHHPVWGALIAMAVVIAMYFWVGKLGATIVVDAINQQVFENVINPWCDQLVSGIPWEPVRQAIMDPDFGIVPNGLFLAFGLVMPVLLFFYFSFNLLVDSGYLPRVSILFDRLFRLIGLNGKGIIPLVMGFSCVTMALITVRMLETKKERIIASFLLLLGMPCAPLLAVMLVILADLPTSAMITVFGIIITQTLFAGYIARRVIPGMTPDFIMVVPPMKAPHLGRVALTTLKQTYAFMKEAVPLFLLASVVLWVFHETGGLSGLIELTRPFVEDVLGLPEQTVQVLLKTFIRREAGAAELEHFSHQFSNLQIVITLVVMTFLTPCINSLIVLFKERGIKTTVILVVLVSLYALAVGAILNAACHGLGITFA